MKRTQKYPAPLPMTLFWLVLGAALFLGGVFGVLDNFWSGMGGGLLAVGILQLIRTFRYRSNEDYRTQVERANNDERNKFLANKAWAWAGYLFVMISAVGTIAFKLLGREDIMFACSISLCLLLVLYWLCYLYLSRKY